MQLTQPIDSTPEPYGSGHGMEDTMQVKKAVAIIQAINHPLRYQILQLLNDNSCMAVKDIYVTLRLDEVFVSKQLAILRREKFVFTERKGKEILYSVNYNPIVKVAAFTGMVNNV